MKTAAFTELTAGYPAFVNFTRNDDGSVQIIVRSPAKVREGERVCGRDCRPGWETCNNYCNADPSKPMPDSPLRCTFTDCGPTAQITIPQEEWEKLAAAMEQET